MKPIQEMLNRIRWDKEFAKAIFKIGYYDRLEDKVIVVPFHEVYFDEQDHYNFQIVDDDGMTHTIPLHRIRELYKDGQLIWRRSPK